MNTHWYVVCSQFCDSYEYTHYTIFKRKKRKSPKIIPNQQLLDFSQGLKNEFEIAMVNKPSVFEPQKFYCISTLPSTSEFYLPVYFIVL